MPRLATWVLAVQVANNGERALQLANGEARPDLILLDVMMPGMDGYRVLQEIKGAAHTAQIPVIFLTARSNEEDHQPVTGGLRACPARAIREIRAE